jgi:hypothetical protein
MNKSIGSTLFILLLLNCTNPIEKKKKEFENCKITIDSFEIKNLKLFIVPLAPKAYIKANIKVENTNDVPVDIEKFQFKTYLLEKDKEDVLIANVVNEMMQTVPAKETKIIETEMQTLFEENTSMKNISTYMNLAKSYLNGGELDLLMDGNIEFNTFAGKISIPVKEKVKANLNKKKSESKKP